VSPVATTAGARGWTAVCDADYDRITRARPESDRKKKVSEPTLVVVWYVLLREARYKRSLDFSLGDFVLADRANIVRSTATKARRILAELGLLSFNQKRTSATGNAPTHYTLTPTVSPLFGQPKPCPQACDAMGNTTITEFCKKHSARSRVRHWALATGCATMGGLWQRDDLPPDWRIWIATRPGVLNDKTLRLFACWSVRQVWRLLPDEHSRNAVEVAERYAAGNATDDELNAARTSAWAAWSILERAPLSRLRDAAMYAAMAAAWAAWTSPTAACDAAWSASAAACDAAWSASTDSSDAALAASTDSSEAQSSWLAANANPSFEVEQ
jgi:hypothetical protein